MATLTNLDATVTGVFAATPQTLTAADVLVYEPTKKQLLHLNNTTAGSLTVVIDGADGTTINFPGVPAVSVSGGYAVGSIPATTGAVAIPLDTISGYLQGVVTVTGGTGITALLLQY